MTRPDSRRRRARDSGASAGTAPAYVTRQIPYYAMLDEEALVRIEAQADRLLEQTGVEFRDDPAALALWRNAGADVQGTRVRAPSALVRSLLATAPAEFIQHSRNAARSVRIGGRHQVFAPVYGSPFVRDLEGGRRYGSLDDQ